MTMKGSKMRPNLSRRPKCNAPVLVTASKEMIKRREKKMKCGRNYEEAVLSGDPEMRPSMWIYIFLELNWSKRRSNRSNVVRI